MGDLRGESEPLPDVGRTEAPRPLQILGRINFETSNAVHILDTHFQNLQSRTDSYSTLLSYFRDPQFDKWVFRYSGPETPVIFELIEKFVPEKDRCWLIKELLRADMSSRTYHNTHSNSWQESWYQVCNVGGWEEAKELLYEERVLAETNGDFLDCALVFLAEKSLEGYQERLEDWDMRSLDDEEVWMKNDCIAKFRGILSNFHHAKENVDPCFYRFLLRFELHDGTSNTSGQRSYKDEYRQKYIQLTTLRANANYMAHLTTPSVVRGDTRSKLALHTTVCAPLSLPDTIFHPLPPTPPTPSDPKSFDQSVYLATSHIVEVLRTKWYSLEGFEEYLNDLFTCDGLRVFIFMSPHSSSENLFNAITRYIPEEAERMSLAKAVLTVSSNTTSYTSHSTPPLLAWWRSFYNPAYPLNYEKFQEQLLNNAAFTTSMEQVISTFEGRKLFMDATISLVGESLLGSLKTSLKKRRERSSKGMQRQREYLSVLGIMRDRGLAVDKSWTMYMLDSM